MIEWTEQAIRQLVQAENYIALSNSEEFAERITMQIVNSVQQLARFPCPASPDGLSGPASWSFLILRLSWLMPLMMSV